MLITENSFILVNITQECFVTVSKTADLALKASSLALNLEGTSKMENGSIFIQGNDVRVEIAYEGHPPQVILSIP